LDLKEGQGGLLLKLMAEEALPPETRLPFFMTSFSSPMASANGPFGFPLPLKAM
jgi:hypothetical protein